MKHLMTKLAVASCLATALGQSMAADGEIKLKLGGFLPNSHYGVVHGTQVFMDEVVARTKGKVKFEYYPAQQIGKIGQLMDLAQAGVVDVVEVTPGLMSQKMPLVGIIELPGIVKEACAGSAALRTLGTPGGTIYQSDFAPNGLRVLGFSVLPPYQVISRKPVKTVADLRGMKVRPAGAAMELTLAKLGGVPVKLSGPELYEGMSKGTIDTVMFTFLNAEEYSITSVAKYSAYGYPWGTGALLLSMPEKKFQSLPKDVQDALVEAGKKSDARFCKYTEDSEAESTKKAQAAGVQVHWWTDQQKSELDAALSSVTMSWAKDLDGRGKPGTRAVEEFKKAIAGK